MRNWRRWRADRSWGGPAVLRLLVLVVVVFALPMAVTLQLKHMGEHGIEAERDLQAMSTELQVQDGLSWQVISGRTRPQQAVTELTASRGRARMRLDRAVDAALTPGDLRHLTSLQADYSRAVDQELQLIDAGKQPAAAALEATRVVPAFDAFSDDIHEDAARISRGARRARRFGDVGVLLMVLLSLGLTTLVQRRRSRAEVGRQVERRSEARSRSLIDQSADLVLVTDREGQARFLSPSAERLLQLDVTAGPVDLVATVEPADRSRLLAALRDAAPGACSAVEVRIVAGGLPRTFEVSVQDLGDQPAVAGLVVTAHDITDRLELQQEMEHRALHDTLTGLPNRALLADRFDQALRAAQRDGKAAGLLLIDLDRFKEVNDTFGHHYGDALLTQIGPRLTSVLREVDTVARLGGDEFAVLLPDIAGVADVVAVAGKLLASLRTAFHVEGVALDIEASIGVVVSGEHGTDATTLLQRADIAMYVAKTQNLGVFAYDPAVDGHSPAKLALLGDLRRALERAELVLHYQPKVSISTGDVVGAEALVRWQHPTRGLLFPDAFVPLAEHTGLIGPLTRYVLGVALAQTRVWADAGRPLTVSVNLSARNLLDDQLPGEVAGLLARHGVPAGLLELEVTEAAVMTEPVRARRLLEQLSALGVRLSIDDFGAGYTSLGHLRTLPVTELKIDRSFVTTMTEDRSNALIVNSVVDLGHNLGLTLIAEGVESEQALRALADYGCDIAQGFHVSRPVTPAAFDAWRAARTGPDAGPAMPRPRPAVPSQPDPAPATSGTG